MAIVPLKTAPTVKPNELFTYTSGTWFTCSAEGEMQPRLAEAGMASEKGSPVSTIPALLKKACVKKGAFDALLVERPCPPLKDGKCPDTGIAREKWAKWSYDEYHSEVRRLAKAFIGLGFKQYDSVNIWGFNAPEWVMSAVAAGYAGGKSAGIYPTDTNDIAAYKIAHSNGSICVVEDQSKITKLTEGLNAAEQPAKNLKAFIVWDNTWATSEVVISGNKVPVLSWADAIAKGESVTDAELDTICDAVKPSNASALIYTSGTTGAPKAVMVSHDNLVYQSNSVLRTVGRSCGYGMHETEERLMSYLPLSHVAGMMVDIVTPITMAALAPARTAVFFGRQYDLKVGSIGMRLTTVNPTMFLGVPLVWDKMRDRIMAVGASTTGLKKILADKAKASAFGVAKNIQLGGDGSTPSCFGCATTLLKAVKAKVGLAECKYALTGAAPIQVATLEYFGSLGIYINELYGMSECAGVCTVSTDQAHAWGSIGWELPGTEVKSFKVDTHDLNKKEEAKLAPDLSVTDEIYMGELCFRGRGIMMGYLCNPNFGPAHVDEINKKTAETIDSDGWLHSGDKGLKTDKGLLKITGRFKELIIGEGGENIAPVPIEDSIKAAVLGINEVMMIGDKRKYNVAFITLKAVGANGEYAGTDALDGPAKGVNLKVTKISEALKDPVWQKTIQDAIDKTNANTKVCINNAFKIQKWTLLPTNFSEETNDLTPTKKLKRKNVEDKFKKLVDYMYETDGRYVEYKAFD